VRAAVEIAAPAGEVFAFFDDLANAAVLLPSLIEITKVEPVPGGGRRLEYTTRDRSGEPVEASSEHIEYAPPHRTVTKGVQSGVSTLSTREFAPTDAGGTRVAATVEWSVPVLYIAKLVEFPLRKPYRRSMHEMLAAAKAAIEQVP
jgi:uncharacterized protein YndB with AHSA1/START domain